MMNLQADIVKLIVELDPDNYQDLLDFIREIQNPDIRNSRAVNRLIEKVERRFLQERSGDTK